MGNITPSGAQTTQTKVTRRSYESVERELR
jgi:hypothetical protein